jgi:hypothetical protein
MACHTERSLPRSAFDFWPKLLVRSAGRLREQKCGSKLKTKTPNSALLTDASRLASLRMRRGKTRTLGLIMRAPYKVFAPWVLVVSGVLLIAAVIAAQNFEFTTSPALGFAAASCAVVAVSAVAALAAPWTRRHVLRAASAVANDRGDLLAAAWVYGGASICLALWALAR